MVFVAAGALIAAWISPGGELDADDAAEIAVASLDSVGFDGTVVGDPELGAHEPPDGDPVDAWSVMVEVDGEEIELRVQSDLGAVIYVDDRIGEGGTGRLLSDEDFVALGGFRDHRLRDQRNQQNLAGTLGAAAVAAVGLTLSLRSASLLPAPSTEEVDE